MARPMMALSAIFLMLFMSRDIVGENANRDENKQDDILMEGNRTQNSKVNKLPDRFNFLTFLFRY